MNARLDPQTLPPHLGDRPPSSLRHDHLDALEEETIFILREVAATFERPALDRKSVV